MTLEGINSPEEIRKAVKASYGARASGAPMKEDTGACCGSGSSSSSGTSPALNCCTRAPVKSCCSSTAFKSAAAKMGYTSQDVENVPEGANLGLGCGAPLKQAGVEPGMTVLDLGSGAGFDAFLAANAVGPHGRVIGVDMTPEMVAKARSNAAKRAARAAPSPQPTIEFHEGLIEQLPLDNDLVDVIISNCVINLSPDKDAVFREAYRVLKKGGKVCVSDIVLTEALPSEVQNSLAAYMGCIAGASLMEDYIGAMKSAGFVDVEVTTKPAFSVLMNDDPVIQGIKEGLEEGQSLEALAARVVSASVIAYKK